MEVSSSRRIPVKTNRVVPVRSKGEYSVSQSLGSTHQQKNEITAISVCQGSSTRIWAVMNACHEYVFDGRSLAS